MPEPQATTDTARAWNDAQLALLALQVDPVGLAGAWVRAGHGPVRDLWLGQLQQLISCTKVPANTDTERLLGGIDLAATLQTGRLVQQMGLLTQAQGGLALLPMAERAPSSLVAQVVQQLEHSTFGVVALDESDEDEAPVSESLRDRVAFWLDLRRTAYAEAQDALEALSPSEVERARHSLAHLSASDEQIHGLCTTAWALGIHSLRAPLLALRLASVHAALMDKDAVEDEDLQVAARMVLGPRATQLPAASPPPESEPNNAPDYEPPSEPPQEPPQEPPTESGAQSEAPPPNESPDLEELMMAAAIANLPPRMLDQLMLGSQPTARTPNSAQGTSGQARSAKLRGRPLPPRRGSPHAGARMHLLATLRAAAPKQKLRSKGIAQPSRGRLPLVQIRAEDFHIHRFEQRSSSCIIFALDASGSAAYQRLAEAKGAVELLLQQSYARRDSVCVIAFRGSSAPVLLPPTRSLVRAKRALAGLPGGGGTPVALGLQAALQTAQNLKRQGSTPLLVVLSDGRANVTLKGVGGRPQAQADALHAAGQWRAQGWSALWIDTAVQPEAKAQQLAATMGATYFPMPHVQAQRMANVVGDLMQLKA
jgi:magnesium chelatase subunit D